MSFLSKVTSRFRGKPISLYHFVYGTEPTAFIAYTDCEKSVLFEGIAYNPIPVDRSQIVAAGNLDKTSLTVSVPKTSRLAELFRVYPPGQIVRLVIRQGHADDSQFKVSWTGRVVQAKRNKSTVDVTCEPLTTMLRRVGLRRHYQISCAHVLYGAECRASQSVATTSLNTVIVSGSRVTLSPGWNVKPVEKYIGGMISWMTIYGREYRTILRVTDQNTLRLSGPLNYLASGGEIRVILGCNHQMPDCLNIHNNIHNFGGQPFIPLKNPTNTNPFS